MLHLKLDPGRDRDDDRVVVSDGVGGVAAAEAAAPFLVVVVVVGVVLAAFVAPRPTWLLRLGDAKLRVPMRSLLDVDARLLSPTLALRDELLAEVEEKEVEVERSC